MFMIIIVLFINRSSAREEASDEDEDDPLIRFHPVNACAQDNHQMEVGFIWLSPKQQQHQSISNVVNNNVPMMTKARKKVLNALYRISGVLWRHPKKKKNFETIFTEEREAEGWRGRHLCTRKNT
jgi:hypothetical protein